MRFDFGKKLDVMLKEIRNSFHDFISIYKNKIDFFADDDDLHVASGDDFSEPSSTTEMSSLSGYLHDDYDDDDDMWDI